MNLLSDRELSFKVADSKMQFILEKKKIIELWFLLKVFGRMYGYFWQMD